MTRYFIRLSLGLMVLSLLRASAFDPAASLVEIEITKQSYDYTQPWVIRNQQTRKNGIVIDGKQVLTTADGLSGHYLCRVKKGGVSRHYTAQLKWIDYYANVALFDVEAADFHVGMQAVPLATEIPQSGTLQVYRWRSGRIEERAAEIIRLYSGSSKMSYLQHLALSVSSEIESAGWSEIVCDDDQLIGLTASASAGKLVVLPAPFIADLIERHAQSDDPGLGYFDFSYMPGKNPALLASKDFEPRDVGVVITDIGRRRLANNTLKVGDILLEVDGYTIDSEGKYIDPTYGRLSLHSLATRAHAAGEPISMRLWREGAECSVDYILPRADFDKSLIPEQRYDAAPNYLVVGGLVFQPLSGPYLNALGSNKPVLLDYYAARPPLANRDGLVILSRVLPDDYNRGYEELRFQLLDTINGQTIHDLESVERALQQPIDGFHRLHFMHDENVRHLILDAATLEPATQRILEHYRIPSDRSL